MSNDKEKYAEALRFQKEGNHRKALEAAYHITTPLFRAGVLIDSGADAGKPAIIRQGIEIFEDELNKDQSRVSRASLLYNIGNGYFSIYKVRWKKGARLVAPNDDDLRMAKRAYRAALAQIRRNSPELHSQILVNYGNCLSSLGRCFEAIEAYGMALAIDPKNGMAAGNLGVELGRVADITDRYFHPYLLVAHHALAMACGPTMHLSYGGPDARRGFQAKLQQLQGIIDAHKGGLAPVTKISFAEPGSNKERYAQFCLRNGLFLNAWAGDQDVAPAISDDVAFGAITVRCREAQLVPELLRILNEIKESFAAARYLLYLSRSSSDAIDDISALTTYFGGHTSDLNGLPLGLCKSAYSRAFDVLDKVGRIINVYFGIGGRRDSFWEIFAEKQSRYETHQIRFVARPSIVSTKNYSLFALSDLCIDYFEGEAADFKELDSRRNRITHDYLAVLSDAVARPVEGEIAAKELYRQALATLKLAKYATLYAVSAMHLAQNARGSPEGTQVINYSKAAGITSRKLGGLISAKEEMR